MSYELLDFADLDPKTWDDFVLSQPSGSIHQITTWKHFQEQIPGREEVAGYGLRESSGSQILMACLCIKRHTGFSDKFWFYSPRGPVFRSDIPQEAWDFFTQKVSHKLKAKGGLFWRLDPFLLHHSPFTIRKSRSATQQYQPTDSLVLDITSDEDQILAQMKRKGRYNIKLSREKGVQIKIIESQDITQNHIDQYWNLSQETAGRDGFSTHDKAYHEAFVKHLSPFTTMGFAYYQNKLIAAVINTHCADKAIYYFGASSGNPEYRPLMAPYLLQWEMIRYAKTQGAKSYDFTGITPINQPDHPYKGITQFKLKFGGQRHTYQEAREVVLSGFWHRVYRIAKWFKKSRPKRLLLTFCLCLLILTGCAEPSGPSVSIGDQTWKVEIVDDQIKREKGLMGVETLEKDKGMLFVFEAPGDYGFWMKDTLIPLDIIWISETQKVIHISYNTPPCSKENSQTNQCPLYRPNAPARYVLEVKGGVFEGTIGDEVLINNL